MHLEAVHFQLRHARKGAHLGGIPLHARHGGPARRAVFVSRGSPGEHQRCGHALEVPLEGAAYGFVKVVDVEDQPAVGRGIGAQVPNMSVAAELAHDAGRGQLRQVRRHHRSRAAKVREGRFGHQLVLQGDERRHAAAHRSFHDLEGRRLPRLGFEGFVLVASHLFAPRLTQRATFFGGRPAHIPGTYTVQFQRAICSLASFTLFSKPCLFPSRPGIA